MKYKAFDPHEFVTEKGNDRDNISKYHANKLADEIMKLRKALYDLSQENKTLKDGLDKLKKSIDGIIVFVKDGK